MTTKTHLTKAETTKLKADIRNLMPKAEHNSGWQATARRCAERDALNKVLALLGEQPID